MRISPWVSITGPMSLRMTPASAPGRAAPSSIARIPPREVPRKIARPMSSAVSTREHVGKLDRKRIILRIGVMVGAAAPARVDREEEPRLGRILAEREAKLMEIRAVAGEAGQADDGQAARGGRSVAAHMQPQAVLRGDEQAFEAGLLGGIGEGGVGH